MTKVRHDRFVPIRKSDMLDALIERGALAAGAEREKFGRFCDMLASIFHYEYFAALERLRNDYYYFNPAIAPPAAVDRKLIDRSYADLVQTLDRVVKDANFVELPHVEIGEAHSRRRVLRVEVKAPLNDFREVRFYRRGLHIEQFIVAEWLGLRKRKVEAEVYDDVVMLAAMKSEAAIGSRREIKALERRPAQCYSNASAISPPATSTRCFPTRAW